MQIQKENIRRQTLEAAKNIFLKKGFSHTSMRDIAKKAKVSLSNIYNYFSNKDEIYRETLAPLLLELEKIIHTHKNSGHALRDINDANRIKTNIQHYIDLVTLHKQELRLLLLHSQGSSLERFKDEYTNQMTDTVLKMFNSFKSKHKDIKTTISPFFIHTNTAWMFSILEEMVMHELTPKEIELFVTEYIQYETAGWRQLLGIKPTKL